MYVFACENDNRVWRCRQLAQADLGTLSVNVIIKK